jgi:hypothetical protein
MTGLRNCLLVIFACLIFIAGCTNPGSFSPGSAGNIPTNEPTPLPTPGTAPLVPPSATPYATVPVTYATPVSPVYTQPTYTTPYPTPGNPSYSQPSYPYQRTGYIPSRISGYRPPGLSPGYTPVPPAVPEPSNPADIVFQHYSDQYFGIDYPSAWKFSQSNYVQFTSASGRVTFTAEVDNFPSGLSGNYRLNPDISAVQDLVSREFPGYAPGNIISDYHTTTLNGVPAAIYTVRIPDGTVAYTRYMLVTVRHAYRFTFMADTATFDEVTQLRNYMFGTLTVNDQA